MSTVKAWVAGLAFAVSAGAAAIAADISKIEWGQYTVLSNSSNLSDAWSAETSSDGMTLTLSPKHVVAKADGNTPNAAANLGGEFQVAQSERTEIESLKVTVYGYLIKNAGTQAKLDLTIGGKTETVEWTVMDTGAGSFTKTFDIAVENGALPNPFSVSAAASASKNGTDSGVLLSVDKIEVHLVAKKAKVALLVR